MLAAVNLALDELRAQEPSSPTDFGELTGQFAEIQKTAKARMASFTDALMAAQQRMSSGGR